MSFVDFRNVEYYYRESLSIDEANYKEVRYTLLNLLAVNITITKFYFLSFITEFGYSFSKLSRILFSLLSRNSYAFLRRSPGTP